MYGLAGHAYTPGQPRLDGFDAVNRQRDREAKASRRAKLAGTKTHVRSKQQRRDQKEA